MVTARDGEGEVLNAGFSPFVCACFTLNYIVGTGFLALPWAFYQAGWFFSGTAMVCVCIIANVGSDYLLTAMARADCIKSILEEGHIKGGFISLTDRTDEGTSLVAASSAAPPMSKGVEHEKQLKSINGKPCTGGGYDSSLCVEDAVDDTYGSVTPVSSIDVSADVLVPSKGELLLVGVRRIDVPELCQIFLGDWGFKGYAVCVSLYLYGALWSFTSVFGSAVAIAVPPFGRWDPYAVSVLGFALIVVPMSFLELSEQKTVQVILSGGRIFMIVLMVLTPIAAVIFRGGIPSSDITVKGVPHFDDQVDPAGAPFLDLSGIHRMFPIMVYAAIFHFSIPALAEEVTEKSQLGSVFGLTFVLCGSLYTCIGGIDAWYFGDGIEQSSNLNWGPYHGGTGVLVTDANGEPKWMDVALWACAVAFFVVMFPAINVISAFPLHAFSLGNSLMGVYYGEKIHEVEQNRCIRSIFRAIACIPPLFGGLFVRDLGTITDYAGLAGLAIAFCFPALLYISSGRKAKRMDIPTHTYYERLGSSFGVAVAVLVFGALSIIGVFMSLVLKG